MEFTTAHLQFVKSTTHFNQPFKTEFNKISHILMGFEYFYPEISSQIKYNFNINLYCVKIQRNIPLTTINEIKIFNIPKIIFYKVITVWCIFYSYYPVFIITSHLLFLKAHFLVKPNASLLGKICSPAGRRITT